MSEAHLFCFVYSCRIEELTCGGMVNQVREAFAETMTSVVQLAARYPIACCNSIGLLCIVPYTRYVQYKFDDLSANISKYALIGIMFGYRE